MCNSTHATYARASRQGGAVLIIGLMLLLVMTIIGVVALQSTTLDERISANAQYKMLTFQAAEAGLQQAWEHDDLGLKTFPDAVPGSTPVTLGATATNGVPALPTASLQTGVAGANAEISVTQSYVGSEANPIVPGYSLGAGRTGHYFDIDATATIDGAGARSTHRRSAVVVN